MKKQKTKNEIIEELVSNIDCLLNELEDPKMMEVFKRNGDELVLKELIKDSKEMKQWAQTQYPGFLN